MTIKDLTQYQLFAFGSGRYPKIKLKNGFVDMRSRKFYNAKVEGTFGVTQLSIGDIADELDITAEQVISWIKGIKNQFKN